MDSNKTTSLSLPDFKAHLIFWPIIILGLVLDLWTKKAVFDWLDSRPDYVVIDGFMKLVMARNDGAAFGLFSGKTFLLTVVPIGALITSLIFFLSCGRQQRKIHIALGLIAAGACGNLYDRIFNDGWVRDFIYVYYRSFDWPAFNIADSLLCIGVAVLVVPMVWEIMLEKLARIRDRQRK